MSHAFRQTKLDLMLLCIVQHRTDKEIKLDLPCQADKAGWTSTPRELLATLTWTGACEEDDILWLLFLLGADLLLEAQQCAVLFVSLLSLPQLCGTTPVPPLGAVVH